MVNYTQIFEQVGNQSSALAISGMQKLSETLGIDSTNLSTKLLSIVFVLLGLLLVSKITNKLTKVALYFVGIIFIVSLFFSIS